jgi:hypothetical protein
MKKTKSLRHIDVNLDELDRIIDRATQAPLSAAESQKLRSALHAIEEATEHREDQRGFGQVSGSRDSGGTFWHGRCCCDRSRA